jgi:hypothetical protein
VCYIISSLGPAELWAMVITPADLNNNNNKNNDNNDNNDNDNNDNNNNK